MRLTLLPLALALTACGGSGSDATLDTTNPPAAGIAIQSFAVAGYDTAAGAALISPGVSSGNFTAAWDVNRPDNYNVSLFVSANDTLSDADVEFEAEYCFSAGNCKTGTFTADCFFDGSNGIRCGSDTPVDLTSFLPAIPWDGYIIARACESTVQFDCTTSAVPVRLE